MLDRLTPGISMAARSMTTPTFSCLSTPAAGSPARRDAPLLPRIEHALDGQCLTARPCVEAILRTRVLTY